MNSMINLVLFNSLSNIPIKKVKFLTLDLNLFLFLIKWVKEIIVVENKFHTSPIKLI